MPDIIQTNSKILGGQPVVRGTRIPISRIVALHIQGYKISDFKKEYPDIASALIAEIRESRM